MSHRAIERGNFTFIETDLPDVLLIIPIERKDRRGVFLETYRQDIFADGSVNTRFVQDNMSVSREGVIRGLHLQTPPKYQEKLVQVPFGEILDVAVLVHPEEHPKFGRMVSFPLSNVNHHQLYIGQSEYNGEPVLYAHGFRALHDHTVVTYKTSEYYSSQHDIGLNPFDPNIGYNVFLKFSHQRHDLEADGLINPKDNNWPNLDQLAKVISSTLPERRRIWGV